MTLFDTSVILDALEKDSEHFEWALNLIIEAAAAGGAAVNAVTLAELCAGDRDPAVVSTDLQNWELQVLDVPAAAAPAGGGAPKIPLPDFFIGAHAEIMGWKLATRDSERIAKNFPKVVLVTPKK